MDLMHTQNHVAPLYVKLCTLVNELLRKIVRLDTVGGDSGALGSKASGIKIVAKVLKELMVVWPQVVMVHLSLLLSHLESKL